MYSKSAHTTFKLCSCDFKLNIPIFQGSALLLSAVAHCKCPSGFPKYMFQMQWYFLAKVVHSDLALLRKPLKRYMRREIMAEMQPKIRLHFPVKCDILCFWTKLFLSSRRPFITNFTTKSHQRSETYKIRKSMHCGPGKSMFWEEFLFLRGKRRASY